jgi:hypothetical protein
LSRSIDWMTTELEATIGDAVTVSDVHRHL